ncbi:hypothetical protein Syn7502_02857 [Synechococcus sp. PCC 7502]|uniref:hypothetical protein n=1 Tax=Synechococcus sp. PCC 7502 TaxID=1173263 RepID=UPI00029FF247|nr:hypothetical protein [Synechococcus sp. PCC 7502]AFY74793.1 hypothetical protein Syn7502_02857 [Synechococcus sp. PCC 7502]
MSESITLELPEPLVKKVKEIAMLNHKGIEEMLIEWIDRTINEIPVDSLPDDQVLALCDLQMNEEQQIIFSDLQSRHNEGQLNPQEISKLNELMQVYRRGSVQKAKAIHIAVKRGLMPPLNVAS